MEEIINFRKQNYQKVLQEVTELETTIVELELNSTPSDEEVNQTIELKKRLEKLQVLKEKALASLNELETEHVVRSAVDATPLSLEQELKRLAQQENVLKGMLTRKPSKLSFNSTRDSPLGFIEEFGKFAMR
jgi:hypothetical protein